MVDMEAPFFTPEELIKIRREEARRAREFLGVEEFIEFGIEDGTISTLTKNQKRKIKEQIGELLANVDGIFIPTKADLHADHKATHDLVCEVIKEGNIDNILVLKYFVWFFPDFFKKNLDPAEQIWVVRLSEQEMDRKLEAIRCHSSQIKNREYDQMAKSINRYLAIIFKSPPFSEVIGIFNVSKKLNWFANLIKECKNVTTISHGLKSNNSTAFNIRHTATPRYA